jgi:uncharacterized protein (DUF362 family)
MSKEAGNFEEMKSSRRDFIRKAGTIGASMLVVPYLKPSGILAYDLRKNSSYLATVAVTNTTNTPADSYTYDDSNGGVKQKVKYLLDLLDQNDSNKVSALFSQGKKVVIKINLTGGSGSVGSSMLQGVPITEAQWTNPAVIQAVAQFIIDAGVNASDITIVDSLGSADAFTKPAFQDYANLQTALGCNLVDLSKGTFVDVATGSGYFNYSTLNMNQILTTADVYVSIPKLKQHAEAGFTCSLKNQVGTVPQSKYVTQSITYRRQMLHSPTNGSSAVFLPRSVCDLNAARPVHLAVVDGIRNAKGGEGTWNPTFVPFRNHVLLAGLDPVATDSIGAKLMGLDPEATKLPLPAKTTYGDTECDNYMNLLNTKGVGTNQLSQIQIVGDGSSLLTSVSQNPRAQQPAGFQLCSNYPNPFNPSTMIVFFAPSSEFVTLKVYDMTGREIETLITGVVPSGEHRLQWSATGLPSGVYLCRLEARGFAQTIKMIYQK